MKRVRRETDGGKLRVTHPPPGRIPSTIQSTGDRQTFGGGGVGDQANNGFIIREGFPAPVRGDEREEAMLDLVPFAGAGREMTDLNRKARFIRQLLQFQFPEPQPIPIAAASIRRDQ